MSAVAYSYVVGDIRYRFACRKVIATTVADVIDEKKRYADDHGIAVSGVYSERLK